MIRFHTRRFMQEHINLTDPTLAATLELVYLSLTLESLRHKRGTAIDVGAHRGDVTAALSDMGFRVLAVEPQPTMTRRLADRFRALLDLDLLHIERCAASNRRGVGTMYLGSASTVNTLERDWTRVAFPEEFRSPEKIDVPLYTIAELAEAAGFERPAFVKIDVEGHELPALQGLFRATLANEPPPVIMFEANQRFPDAVRQCLALLDATGYGQFDIFIREGIAPIAAERFGRSAPSPGTPGEGWGEGDFERSASGCAKSPSPLPSPGVPGEGDSAAQVRESGPGLPAAWHACNNRYFYANIIAYHSSVAPKILPADPVQFLESYQLEAARDVLRRGLRLEQSEPTPVHAIWSDARQELRKYILESDWRDFLSHPVCKHMFFRGRWGAGQDEELAALSSSEFGRELLQNHRDPQAGVPRLSEKLPGLSTNMLGMLYYLHRVEQQCQGTLPQRVIEVGGGYGAFALAYLRQNPSASYVIVDLPEMLAIQHYFLSLAMPERRITFAAGMDAQPEPGQILLLPARRLGEVSLSCDLLFSTFGFSELPRELQQQIESTGYFDASRIFLAGQFASEFPDLNLVHHDEVVGAARQRFTQVQIERFHTGDNYLLIGSRSAA
jgi:FkbM family methyltransferase